MVQKGGVTGGVEVGVSAPLHAYPRACLVPLAEENQLTFRPRGGPEEPLRAGKGSGLWARNMERVGLSDAGKCQSLSAQSLFKGSWKTSWTGISM